MARIILSLAALLAATTATSATCTNPSIRKPWTALTEDEKASYVNSTLCLMDPSQAPAKVGSWGATSRWEELVVAHIAQVRYIHTVVRDNNTSSALTNAVGLCDFRLEEHVFGNCCSARLILG